MYKDLPIDPIQFEAQPLCRILDANTRLPVGWFYRWDSGELAALWLGDAVSNITPDIAPHEADALLAEWLGSF